MQNQLYPALTYVKGCAGVLNLFGGVLNQKRRAEKALEDSGIAYTIVRPGASLSRASQLVFNESQR